MLDQRPREPLFNVPAIVIGLVALLGVIHGVLVLVLTDEQTTEFLLLFAFIPARYDAGVLPNMEWPGGWAADIWSFASYAFIHSNLNHLIFNSLWLLAFGSPLAWRFGAVRFAAFFIATSVGGAVLHLVTHLGELLPMIGASAAISGAMAGVMRFLFQRGDAPMFGRAAAHAPAASLRDTFRDRRVIVFLLVWLAFNLLVGLGSFALPGLEHAIAWEAHIGGFVVGLLAFSLFDPVRKEPGGDRRSGGGEILH
jgi:membrane associated rhomboid family serine protease